MTEPSRPRPSFRDTPLWKTLGPGVVMAGAAVGVSHLVQATRAGADYGYLLLWAVLLACLSKYPFLEFAPRYAAATGESLVTGYRRLGPWALWTYVAITVGTMFAVLASVTLVTAGIAGQLFGTYLTSFQWSLAVLGLCGFLILSGRYPALDSTMKAIMAVLGVLTVLAVALAFTRPGTPDPSYIPPAIWNGAGLAFVIALMGWMPIPLDVGVWHSLWTLERRNQTGHVPTVRQAVTDFNLGYGAATIMAVLFLALGATLMYGSGDPTPVGSVAFAERLISLYRTSLGAWSVPIIGTAALVTMFSTTLAVSDGIPRVFQALYRELVGAPPGARVSRAPEVVSMAALFAGAILILSIMSERLTGLVDLATTLSFLTTPILAVFNLRLLTGAHTPEAARPKGSLLLLARASAAFLVGFALLFLYWRFLL